MDTPIVASFKWSEAEFLSAQQVKRRYSPLLRKVRRRFLASGLIFVAGGVGFLITHGFLSAGIPFLVMGVGLLAWPLFGKRAILKHYAQRTERDMMVNWEFRAGGLRCQTEASSGEMAWSVIARVLRTPQGFVLYLNDLLSHWVPVHAFRDAQELERFSQLVKSRVERYDQVG
jgi:hypothetical protein